MLSKKTYSFPTKIIYGDEARLDIEKEVKQLGMKCSLIVTDKGVSGLPIYDFLVDHLNSAGIKFCTFDGIVGNPDESEVLKGAKKYKEGNCNGIIAFGGGAPLDVAKAIAIAVSQDGPLFDYIDDGPKPVLPPVPDIIAIPTTAGTGSEVGRSAVISETESKKKQILFSPLLLPKSVIVDPFFTMNLPKTITAYTGIDALTHLLEAYLAKNDHPMCKGIAREGLKLFAKNIREAYHNPTSVSRGEMMMASLMGAVAFQKGLGANHSCAHALSTVGDLHHGLANALMLPWVMRFNAEEVPEAFNEIAYELTGKPDKNEFFSWLDTLLNELEVPNGLAQAGIKESDIDKLVEVAIDDVCHPLNPRPVNRDQFKDLFLKAMGPR